MKRPDYSKFDEFTRAYIACALWSSTDNSTPSGGEPFDKNYDESDIVGAALKSMADDCKDFQTAQTDNLAHAYAPAEFDPETGRNNKPDYDASQAGHDFWLTRNGHGAGFWDRGLEEIGRKLSDAARVYGSSDLYLHRGKIYVSPA